MAKTDDWMPLRLQIWRSGTAFMLPEARGPYLDLILAYWELGPLPNQDEVLQQVARVIDGRLWKRIRQQIVGKFVERDGRLHHERCDTERALAIAAYERKSTAGKAGGQASAQARAKQPSTTAASNCSTLDAPTVNTTTTYLEQSPDGDKHPSDALAAKSKRPTRIPADWMPSQKDSAHASAKGLDAATIAAVAEQFRDHWTGASKNATSADWSAKWRTWIANHISFHGTGPWPRNGAGSSRRNETSRGSVTAARDSILAKAGIRPEGRDNSLRVVGESWSAGDSEIDRGAGPIIDADFRERGPGIADGDEGVNEAASGADGGGFGGPAGSLSETDCDLPGGRSSLRADDAIEREPVVAVVAGATRTA